jgi:transcriptional regulator with XRE-family HTH domain
MRIEELGRELRKARLALELTQADLARAAGISRETLNRLESGLVADLGIRKVLAVADRLGLDLALERAARPRRPDYLRMACTTASVSLRTPLRENELIRALLTGKVPRGKGVHLRALFDEAPPPLLKGLATEAVRWSSPGKLQRNLEKLIEAVGATRPAEQWLRTH